MTLFELELDRGDRCGDRGVRSGGDRGDRGVRSGGDRGDRGVRSGGGKGGESVKSKIWAWGGILDVLLRAGIGPRGLPRGKVRSITLLDCDELDRVELDRVELVGEFVKS